jgi:flagellar hook protein FlgE
MTFEQGLSGLNSASRNLEIIGNNVSNANTVGFKTATAQFSDVFARSFSDNSNVSIGRGTTLDNVSQNFSQGNVTPTNNPLDMAINGRGFFKMKTTLDETLYTRNGQFSVSGEGIIQNVQGAQLMGYPYDLETGFVTGVETPIQFPQQAIAPKTTSQVAMKFNLDSRELPIVESKPFDITDITSYSHTLSTTVYDQLGVDHSVAVYFQKTSNPTASADVTALSDSGATTFYNVYATIDGKLVTPGNVAATSPPTPLKVIGFQEDGTFPSFPEGTDPLPFEPKLNLSLSDVEVAEDGSTFGGDIALDFSGSTQFGSKFGVNSVTQDGYQSASLSSFSITPEGVLRGRYANGQTQDLAQISLVTFRNPDALRPAGNNSYIKTAAAGTEFLARDDDTSTSSITSGALESANLDLTVELVNIISAQRIYQANAQTVKAQDSILQTLVNLR